MQLLGSPLSDCWLFWSDRALDVGPETETLAERVNNPNKLAKIRNIMQVEWPL